MKKNKGKWIIKCKRPVDTHHICTEQHEVLCCYFLGADAPSDPKEAGEQCH